VFQVELSKFVADHDFSLEINYEEQHQPHVIIEKADTLKGAFSTLIAIRMFVYTLVKLTVLLDPYYQRQKCRPMTLVSGGIRFVRIFAEVPRGGGVKRQWGCRQRLFFRIL